MGNCAMVKILSLAEGGKVCLEDLMSYVESLTEVCLPIFNINGQMRKAFKVKLVDCFLMDGTNLDDVAYLTVINMGYLWKLAAPTASNIEKKDKFTLVDYAERIFNTIKQRHPHAEENHLINDCYDVELSNKDAEHQQRNLLFIGRAKNVYPSRNDLFPPLRKCNAFC